MKIEEFSVPVTQGCIVEYLQNNQAVTAWTMEAQAARLRVLNINQREMKLPLARILPWTGPSFSTSASREEMVLAVKRHNSAREKIAETIDTMELWELAQGEMDTVSLEWLATLLWDKPEPDQLAALGRSLLESKTHFRFAPPFFEIYSEEKVRQREAELAQALEQERLVAVGQSWFKSLWEYFERGRPLPLPPPEEVGQRLRELLMERIGQTSALDGPPVWKKLVAPLPTLEYLPVILAEAWGLVPPHYNYALDQAQYDGTDSWALSHAEEIAGIRDRASRPDPAQTAGVSVDGPSTKDIDDAFDVHETDTGYHLRLILACPARHWPFDSDLDRAVAHRFSSLYFPEGDLHLLPENLGTDVYSLRAGQNRPALILEMDLNFSGEMTAFTPRVTNIRIEENLSYAAVERALSSPGSDPRLDTASALTEILQRRRIALGAVVLLQDEPEIRVSGYPEEVQISMEIKEPHVRAQNLVSEFMILANAQIAFWANDQGLPLLFRTQNIGLPSDSPGVWSSPEDIYRIVRTMGPSLLETTPRRHATIGVPAYAPITSPLRRYSDFMNVAQILHWLDNGRPRWTKGQLDERLPGLVSRAEAVARVQRARPRYWKFLAIRNQGRDHWWPVTIVDASPAQATFSLSGFQLFLRAPKGLFGTKVHPGQSFLVRFARVDPLGNEIKVAEARELDPAEAVDGGHTRESGIDSEPGKIQDQGVSS